MKKIGVTAISKIGELAEIIKKVCNSKWLPISNKQFAISTMVSKYLELCARRGT